MTVDTRSLPIGVDLLAEGRFQDALAPLTANRVAWRHSTHNHF